jgi:DNA polymerase-3 subunit beta
VSNPDLGEGVEEIDVEYEGEGVAIGFNGHYLRDVLSVLGEGSRVLLDLNDEASPGCIRSADDDDYRYVVMPMRLS